MMTFRRAPIAVAWLVLALIPWQAYAQDAAVARVVSVGTATGTNQSVELEVLIGSLVNNSDVELFTPTGKVAAKLLTGPNIDLLMRGDKVKVTLALRGAASPAGGYVAKSGTYPNYAAIARALAGSSSATTTSAATPAPAAKSYPASRVCPFRAAELKGALGLTLAEGTPGTALPFSGGVNLSCRYAAPKFSEPELTVNQIAMDNPTQTNGYLDRLAGGVRKIPGDPDGAVFQEKQGDLTNATLHYIRNGTIVELRLSVRPTDTRFAQLQQQLAKLRRIP
jgi:hypothetical protein